MGKNYKLTKEISEIRHLLTYSKELSSPEDGNYYTYSFPVYRQKKKVLLECQLVFNDQSKDVKCEIFDVPNNTVWAALYNNYGDYSPMFKAIKPKLKNEFKRLGVKEYEGRKHCNM